MTEAILREGLGAWAESQTLEFKQTLPRFDLDPNARQEFLKDICALANADGGDVVYGVSEENSVARELLPIAGQEPDRLRRRLIQILDAGVEPRLSGLVMEPVVIEAGGLAWVIRVPASYDAPHRYRVGDSYRFVMRNGTLTSEMAYDQLRTAFDRSATLVERAEAFRRARIERVISGLAWRTLAQGPLAVVQVLPAAAFSRRATIDVGSLHDDNYMAFAQSGWGTVTTRTLSIDGLLVYPAIGEAAHLPAYTHVFRTGAVEAMRLIEHMHMQSIIPSTALATFVRDSVHKFAAALVGHGFSGPAVVAVSLVRARGARLGLGDRYVNQIAAVADRGDLLVPEEWVGTLDSETFDPTVRRMLDTLWQCFDQPRCLEYDENGAWRPQRPGG